MQNTEPMHGLQPDGSYLTPYSLTIAYNAHDKFAAIVAHMAADARVQIVTIEKLESALLSPTIVILGDQLPNNARSMQFQEWKFFIRDVSFVCGHNKFGPEDLLTQLKIPSTHSSIIALEYLLAAEIPGYKSCFDGDMAARGRLLLEELRNQPDDTLAEMCSHANGYERVENLITRAEIRAECMNAICKEAIAHGIRFELDAGGELVPAIAISTLYTARCIDLLPEGINYAVFYTFADVPEYCGHAPVLWYVTIVSRGKMPADVIFGYRNSEDSVAVAEWTANLVKNESSWEPFDIRADKYGPFTCASGFVLPECLWNILPFIA